MIKSARPVLVTLFFVAMMGLLFRDHVLPSLMQGERLNVDSTLVQDAWADRDDFLAVRFSGQERGGLRINSTRIEEDPPRYLFTAQLSIRTPFLSGTLVAAATANRRMELEQFEATVDVPRLRGPDDAEGAPLATVSGRVAGPELLVRFEDAQGERFLRQPLLAPIRLADSLETSLFQVMRKPGQVFRVDVVDPLFGGQPDAALVTFEGVEDVELPPHLSAGEGAADDRMAPASKFSVLLGPVDSSYWMLDSGRVYRREIRLVSRNQSVLRASQRNTAPLLVLTLEDPLRMRERYPALRQLPPIPDVEAAGLIGPAGKIPPNAGGFLALLKGTPLAPAIDEPDPAEEP
ncbi:MAG: hypothetical protein SF028_02350 [Candidatus Sumerlaeia bacterium]|nr:hypothetical protein [Candidatus Sumerlaeia bacterium]